MTSSRKFVSATNRPNKKLKRSQRQMIEYKISYSSFTEIARSTKISKIA